MARYRIPNFKDLMQTYRQAIDDHLTQTPPAPRQTVEHTNFDDAWCRNATAHTTPPDSLTMERCDEPDPTTPDTPRQPPRDDQPRTATDTTPDEHS